MALGLNYNKKFKQGYYNPANPQKYVGKKPIIYRSGLELKYFRFLDKNPKCVKWNSEGVSIPYYWDFDKKWHTYYIDLAATFQINENTIETMLIEIKPYRQTQPPKFSKRKKEKTLLNEQYFYSQNQAKWQAAKEFANKNGFKFIILTEKDLEK